MLKVRRYSCKQCGAEVRSRFLFDGLVFDADYFRHRMAEHRQRKRQQRERVRKMLAESRSDVLQPSVADLEAVPGLTDALDSLIGEVNRGFVIRSGSDFDLKRYESHLQAHIREIPLSMEEIPPLIDNVRVDRIWRFIALIFMDHAHLIDIWQEGKAIMVMRRETN